MKSGIRYQWKYTDLFEEIMPLNVHMRHMRTKIDFIFELLFVTYDGAYIGSFNHKPMYGGR